MHLQSTAPKTFQPSHPTQILSTPTHLSTAQYPIPKPFNFNLKDLTEPKDSKFFINSKKNSLETASCTSTSTTSSIGNLNLKSEFSTKEKNYQLMIERLQKKIETLSLDNRKLSENISIKSSFAQNNENEENEKKYQRKIEKLTEKNGSLAQEIIEKTSEITQLQEKFVNIANIDDKTQQEFLNKEIEVLKQENLNIKSKLLEKERKYEDLDEMYKQKLSQFKKEILVIKAQQKESSIKDLADSINPLNHKIKELEDILKLKNEELQAVNLKLHKKSIIPDNIINTNIINCTSNNINKNNNNSNSNKYSLSTGLIKCNWDEFEKKITNLIDENDKLNNETNFNENYIELESKNLERNEGSITAKLHKENNEMKTKILSLTNENYIITEKMMNFEQTLSHLEEQKEKNLMKISKENHELKQHNDELKQQIELFRQKQANEPLVTIIKKEKSNEKQTLLQNSSPILIINEMMTPSAKNLIDKKEENSFNFAKNKKNSNENLRKNFIPTTNTHVNLQPETVKISMNKTHSSRESQEFPNKYISKNYNNSNNTNYKENSNISKENNIKESNLSFKDAMNESQKSEKEGNGKVMENKLDFLNQKTDFRQNTNYLQTGKNDMPFKKETKVISFNLSDNKGKNEVNTINSSRFKGQKTD